MSSPKESAISFQFSASRAACSSNLPSTAVRVDSKAEEVHPRSSVRKSLASSILASSILASHHVRTQHLGP